MIQSISRATRPVRPCVFACLVIWGAAKVAFAAPHFPGDRPIDVEHIRLDVYVELDKEFVRAGASIVGTARRELTSVKLDAVDFQEVSVEVRYADAATERPKFEIDDETLTIPFGRTLAPGDPVEIVVAYTLNKPKDGLNFFGPSDEEPDAPYVMWSQGQSTSNRYWIPCFDHPNEMQTTEISCTVARPNIAVSNGKLLKVVDNADDTRTFHWKMSKPHVAYLVALVVGDFAHKTDMWRGKPVTYYVRKKFEPWIDNSFANTPRMLEFFSEKIGVPFAWEKYDQICCYNFGGGMENTTCTILGEDTLHDDRAHVDTSSDGLVAHELGHQWFGDLLTCNEWGHLWLNEGFASYCEALWDEESLGADEFALNMKEKADRAREGGARKPVVYPDYKSTGEQFDARAYSKGAWILHMIRRRLGDEMFWKVINAYVTRYEHKTVETLDFQRVVEDVSGESFGRFFYDWTLRPGNPVVAVEYEWLPDDAMARVIVRQKQSSEAFEFPLKLEFRLDTGETRSITRQVTDKRTTVFVPLPSRPVAFRVDPEQAVLMELTEEKPLYLWNAQLTDANAALRIAAVKHLAEEGSDASIGRLASRLSDEPFWGVQAEIAERLGANGSEQAQHALLNGLAIKNPQALAAVVKALGEFDEAPDVLSALAELIRKGSESYRVEAAAIRAYSSACKKHDADAIELFRLCLSRESHREMIREAAFDALARHGDVGVIDELLAWTSAEKSTEVRAAAIRAVGELVNESNVSEEPGVRAMAVLREMLGQKNRRLLRAAIDAADHMRDAAKPLVDDIRRIAESSNRRLARSAKRVLDDIDPPSDESGEVEKLRDELKAAEEANTALRETLEKLEAEKNRGAAISGTSASSPVGASTE
ncbi:MAG: HEAT repeat domain-containing protein [Phycisphaerales bacterium]|nr:HEAT repeat domain-containing protein [Phycisphaerales bacterium]